MKDTDNRTNSDSDIVYIEDSYGNKMEYRLSEEFEKEIERMTMVLIRRDEQRCAMRNFLTVPINRRHR